MATTMTTPIAFHTKNDIGEDARARIVELLNARLADSIDLATQLKVAHWNIKGPAFIALHELFDQIHAAAGEYVDLLAERAVQLGGTTFRAGRPSASCAARSPTCSRRPS